MKNLFSSVCFAGLAFLAAYSLLDRSAVAGMPSPLPTDLAESLQLTESSTARMRAISFFLVAVFGSAIAIRFIWNYLQKDFGWMPKLTIGKSMALVLLWGTAFVIVLTMISGARELMTPRAWEKDGATYRLVDQADSEAANKTETE